MLASMRITPIPGCEIRISFSVITSGQQTIGVETLMLAEQA